MYFRPPSRQALPFLVSLFDSEAYELYSTASGFGVVKKTGIVCGGDGQSLG